MNSEVAYAVIKLLRHAEGSISLTEADLADIIGFLAHRASLATAVPLDIDQHHVVGALMGQQ